VHLIWCTSLTHINVRRAACYGNGCSSLSVLVISLTKNPPLRHHAVKGNTTSLLNPISGYRIRLSTLPRDEIRDQCASQGGGSRGGGRNKRTRETIPFCLGVQKRKESRHWRRTSGRCALVSRIESVPGPLMRYFIGHNPLFTRRPFVLEEWKWCAISMAISLSWLDSRAPLKPNWESSTHFANYTSRERCAK
jgi:hypothetical protein